MCCFMSLCSSADSLSRALRVLIVEDSYLTARSLARMIEELGAEVVGPAPSVAAALALLDQVSCDAAVLDINLGDETVEAVALRLEQTGRPYFFVSGYASPKTLLLDPRFRSRRLLAKPIEPELLSQAIEDEFPVA